MMFGFVLAVAMTSQAQQCSNGQCSRLPVVNVTYGGQTQSTYYSQRQYYTPRPQQYYYTPPTCNRQYAQPVYQQQTAYYNQSYTYATQTTQYYYQQTSQIAYQGGGYLAWINSVRAQYGLGACAYDPDLEAWASANNNAQSQRGLGHHVMGIARRQNSAMSGGFPGDMWMASPAHRAAILDPTITRIGLASNGSYWTFNAN